MRPFSLLVKPAGADCNVDCRYCFYKHKSEYLGASPARMSESILQKMTQDYLSLRQPISSFCWQGGEPTLMGLDFYKKAVSLQNECADESQTIDNALQTNGILLDDQWCKFLHDNDFLVGISIDGPEQIHDHYRLDHAGKGTFGKVMSTIERLKKHEVEFNALVLLTNQNVNRPDEIFDFFVENEMQFLQFIPCVETDENGKLHDFAITGEQYGRFLCTIFDRWNTHGPEKISIRLFDSTMNFCLSGRVTLCTFDRQCNQYIVVEHNGDCYTCDFFVDPEWKLGNLMDTPIQKLAFNETKKKFAELKKDIAEKCFLCRHLAICRGGCTKDRLAVNKQTKTQSPLCKGYKTFFEHSLPKFMELAERIQNNAQQRETSQ